MEANQYKPQIFFRLVLVAALGYLLIMYTAEETPLTSEVTAIISSGKSNYTIRKFTKGAKIETLAEYWSKMMKPNSSMCKDTTGRIRIEEPEAGWQTVIYQDIYVYSAHVDSRGDHTIVRVFGTIQWYSQKNNLQYEDSIFCHLWNQEYYEGAVKAKSEVPCRNETRFPAVDIMCEYDLDPWLLTDDTFVSISRDPCEKGGNLLRVQQHFRSGIQRNFTACLWGPAFNITDPVWLTEWIEANTLFGAERIVIYNVSISSRLDGLLQYYISEGLMEVLPFSPPPGIDMTADTHNNLQYVALGDCQFRAMNQSKYVVGADFDELVVPRHNETMTWSQVMEKLHSLDGCKYIDESNRLSAPSGYSVLQLLFQKYPEMNPHPHCVNNEPSYVKTFCRTKRSEIILPFHKRCKYIGNPLLAHRFKVHYLEPMEQMCELDPNIAALHHYKEKYKPKFLKGSIYDQVAQKYTRTIQSRMWKALDTSGLQL